MSKIVERIECLQLMLEEEKIDVYVIPTTDYHMSEYVAEHFKCREYMSGFTGSTGTLVVTRKEAYLYTDGRYFIQADEELKGSKITLMKMGERDVPPIEKFIERVLPADGCIGFDGKVISKKFGAKMEDIVTKSCNIVYDMDLVERIWNDRPELQFSRIYVLDEKYTGKAYEEKLKAVREKMKEKGVDNYVITSLDDQAWLFNLRAYDIPCNPVFFAFSIVTMDEVVIYSGASIPKSVNVKTRDYKEIYNDLKNITGKVLIDPETASYMIYKSLLNAEIVEGQNPTVMMKAIKNDIEIENLKKCHIKDGIAVTRFMHWLKENVGQSLITEISAADYLERLRKEEAGCVDLSFETISAYGANAAKMHYSADENSNAVLKPEGMLLVDSGGQYYEGTTDITRTFILGPVSDEIKKQYTLVVKGMLKLANARFLYGCTGINLDILARGALWNEGIDYKCGTGHGVGFMLNVHEGPNGFRWKTVPERNDSCILEAGMVTTDEPGVYVEGSHGIRIENELVCREVEENEYGKFMGFETITYAPIDLDGIDLEYLDRSEKKMLNNYHKLVYDTLEPYFNDEERVWLRKYTRNI